MPPPSEDLTPETLRKWRKRRKWTQVQAEVWYLGHDGSAGRTWRRWEYGERSIPYALTRAVQLYNRELVR